MIISKVKAAVNSPAGQYLVAKGALDNNPRPAEHLKRQEGLQWVLMVTFILTFKEKISVD